MYEKLSSEIMSMTGQTTFRRSSLTRASNGSNQPGEHSQWASKKVRVYTYKNPKPLLEEMQSNNVHRAGDIEIYAVPANLLEKLSALMAREAQWMLTHNEGSLMIVSGDVTVEGELLRAN